MKQYRKRPSVAAAGAAALAAIALLPAGFAANQSWIKARSGSFETISEDGRRSAIQALAQFEQFRFALGTVLGKPDFKIEPRIRIILARNAESLETEACKGLHMGRERLTLCAVAESQLDPEVLKSLTRILIQKNFRSMPEPLEQALASFYSTIQSKGTHVMWGTPPPQPERTREWAMLHRIITQPEYSSRARIFLHNLTSNMDRNSAIRNAFGIDQAQFDADTDRYYAAGVFTASAAPNLPINPDRDFATTVLTSDEGSLMRADLLDGKSEGLYRQLLGTGKHASEANEGLGFLALQHNDNVRATEFFEASLKSGSKNVTMMTAYARIQDDDQKALRALQEAISINPTYGPAHWLLGERAFDPRSRLSEWKKATALEPANYEWWARYARFCVEQKQFAEAGRAWVAAAQAAPDEARRNEFLAARGQIEEQRLNAEEEERRKELEAQTREMNRLKAEARNEIAALEARANGDHVPTKDAAVVDWSEINASTMSGTMQSIECSGRQYRLHVTGADGKELIFQIKDVSKVEFTGAKVKLVCGITKAKPVSVRYKPASSQNIAGDVISLEFPH